MRKIIPFILLNNLWIYAFITSVDRHKIDTLEKQNKDLIVKVDSLIKTYNK